MYRERPDFLGVIKCLYIHPKKISSNWHNLSKPILAKHKVISFIEFRLIYHKTIYTFIVFYYIE